ncbi:MAG: hypothetical protein JO266_12310 [Acidobacteria bacterium]|nr:hypothetical protein [Acidobacteriota bacterium]MBV9483985.1 hypothetical protein [Acidobacteriota bacterium]
MWDEVTQAEIELAKQKLAELRGILLRKHEEELKQLDVDEADIDRLARLAGNFTAKYLNEQPVPSQADTPTNNIIQPTPWRMRLPVPRRGKK